ncbi:MAG: GAF domain-containing protein [Deltaproteobacteria bacterium]|jgi:PAS domain S-box-containing protein|nr:GAF domain-containing protein [Deltaproteobacteria bacterium]
MDKNKKPVQRDANKIIKVLFKISEAVNNTLDLNELFKAIHKTLGEIINVDNFAIAFHHVRRDSITFPYYVDENDDDPEEIFNLSKTSSLTGRVIREKAAKMFFREEILRFVSNINKEPLGVVPEIWLGAPLIINNSVKGAVVIQDYKSSTAYGKEDLDLLNSVSQHIALAIERKESKEKLAEQRNILTQIIESSPVGICLVENRTFKWVNNEMHKIFGYEKKEDFENYDVQIIYKSETDYKNAEKIILHDLKESGKADFDFELKKRDNSIFNAQVIITGFGTENPVESTIMIIADISQRELAQKERYEKERLQGVLEMAGAVCHEINQPLQAILGYSELLLVSSKSDDLKDNKLNSIKLQTLKLGEITKKLSNIAHYSTRDYPGNIKIVDIWSASIDAER